MSAKNEEVQMVKDEERVYLELEGSVASLIGQLDLLLSTKGPDAALEVRGRYGEDPGDLFVTWTRPETAKEAEARIRSAERLRRSRDEEKKRKEEQERKLYERLAKKYKEVE